MFQAVFFEADDTLFHTPVPHQERIIQALKRRGVQVDPQQMRSIMNQVRIEMWESPLWPPDTLEKEQQWWQFYYECLLDYLGADIDLAGDLAEEVLYVHHIRPFDEVKDVLKTLKNKFKLGIIANALPSLQNALDKLGLIPFFDVITIASLVQSWKPEERIYQVALDKLRVKPATSVFVDSVEENVATANKLGFKALLLDRYEQYPDTSYLRIQNLREVLQVV